MQWGSGAAGNLVEGLRKPSSMFKVYPNRPRAKQPAPLALLQ